MRRPAPRPLRRALTVPLALGLVVAPAPAAIAAPDATATATGSDAATPAATAARAVEADREALYDLLDATRAEHGLPPLRRDEAVQAVAQAWAGSMAASGALRHNPRLREQMPPGARAGAENIGRGRAGQPLAVHRAWLASTPHRRTALSTAYDTVGIGVVHDASGRLWVTADLGAYG